VRVLVTGATGLVGVRLLPVLAARHEVLALARRPVDGFETVVADLSGEVVLPPGIDAVVHLAQSPRYREWPEGAEDVYAVNVHSTFQLLELARRAGVRHFVQASTGAVYAPSPTPLREDDPVAPNSFYARSRYAAEVLAAGYADQLPTVILRPFFIYGPEQTAMLVPTLAGRVLAGEEITVQGDPGIAITPIHVDDAVRAVAAAVELEQPAVINVAGAETVTMTGLVLLLAELAGREPRIRNVDGTAPDLVADITRMRTVLGVEPAVSLREGLEGVVSRLAGRAP
jgi:UDP-glucose 4-epimerase